MKISVLLFFLCLFSLMAENTYPQESELSLNLKNVTIKKAILEIEKTSDYVFLIADEAKLELNKRTSLSANKESIYTVLATILKDTDLKYTVVERQVSLYKVISLKVKETPVSVNMEIAQQKKRITGRIVDMQGEPVIGANIIEVGTTNGTVTDVDGNFSLQVENNATIRVSYIGYIAQDAATTDKLTFNIVLEEDMRALEEVMVIGYGQQKKESIVGSIVQVTGEQLQRTGGVVNLGIGLTGQLPGVTVVQSTGEPGREDPRIYIRSLGTWNNSQPLVLVDGVERKMNDIDMGEVESISVLKDASATSVFGVKGAQGVILITTKRGKVGKPVITFDINMSTKTVSRTVDKLNSYDQFALRNRVIEYQLNRPSNQDWDSYLPDRMLQYYKQPQANGLQYLFPDVDWIEELIKPLPISYRANVNVSGGTDFAKYFASVASTFDDDMIRTDADPMKRGYKAQNSYERLNFRANLDLNITKSTVFTVNLAGQISNKRNATANATQILAAFSGFSPDMYPLLSYDGSYGYNPQLTNNPNPFMRANSGGVQSGRQTNVTTDFKLKQKLDFITKGLSAGLLFSYDNIYNTTSAIEDGGQARSLYIDPSAIDILYTVNGSYIDEQGNFYVRDGYRLEDYMQGYIFNQATNHDYDWSKGIASYTAESSTGSVFRKKFYQVQLNYDRSFDKHEVGALALFNREQFATGNMFPRYREDWVGRVTYNYDSRYLFESNFAYNGSEKFSSKYRFGFFPSVAVGWMVTQEKFMQNLTWLDRLKFRYSIGKIGNDDFDSSRWAFQTNWVRDEDKTIFGYPNYTNSPYLQYYESVVGNPDLRWETATKQNLGIEIGTLKNRVSMTLDLFKEHRTDIYMSAGRRTIPKYFGQSAPVANLGETKGKGYELELSLRNRFGRHLNAYLTFTHTGSFDKIIYMEDPPLLPDYKKKEGYQINQVVTQIDAGYTNNWDDVYSATGFSDGNTERIPGEYRILDFNGDGVIDSNDAAPNAYPQDRPQHTYGFNFGGEYKGFSLMVQFYGIYNVTRQYSWQIHPFGNLARTGPALGEFVYDAWTPENTDAKYRSMTMSLQSAQSLGRFAYEDGSFLRLKTAEIGYTLNTSGAKFLGINSLRFYLNGNNLFLWSKMVDDREGATGDTNIYPLVRRFNLGMSVKF